MNLNPEKIQPLKGHMNASVAIQDLAKNYRSNSINISICHVYMKFPFKNKISFFSHSFGKLSDFRK